MKNRNCECGKKAVHFRRYEGRHYCKDCFIRSVEKIAKRSIRKHGMVSKGDVIAVGLSGGKDSQALLYILQKIFGNRPDVKVVAISIDEGISGYRKHDLENAKRLCKKLGVEHKIFSYSKEFGKTLDQVVKKVGKDKSCTYCGIARRAILNKAAKSVKATKLAVGHTLDDESQAVILNFMRGDMARAGRIKPVNNTAKAFIPRIKPFRELPEKETAIYSLLLGFEFSEKKCPYATGHRFEIKGFLNGMERKHPGTKHHILASSDRIAPAIQKLKLEKGEVGKCKKCKEPCSQEICKACELWR